MAGIESVPSVADVAARLRAYRYEAGYTAAEAAAKIGKEATTLYKYEAGKLRICEEDMRRLLLLYKVDLSTAFSGSVAPSRRGSRKKDAAALLERRLAAAFAAIPLKERRALVEVAEAMAAAAGKR